MAEEIKTCNKENGCMSQLFGRNCWVANSMIGLIQSHVETLYDRSQSEESDRALKSILKYCDELKAMNKEHWYEEISENEEYGE